MTAPRGPVAPPDDSANDVCLAVVYCAGAGCRSTDIAPAHQGAGAAALRAAVRDRRQAVLVAAPCLRRCQPGGTAAAGWATVGGGRIRWTSPPLVVDGLEGPTTDDGRACATVLAEWIRHAPDPEASGCSDADRPGSR